MASLLDDFVFYQIQESHHSNTSLMVMLCDVCDHLAQGAFRHLEWNSLKHFVNGLLQLSYHLPHSVKVPRCLPLWFVLSSSLRSSPGHFSKTA